MDTSAKDCLALFDTSVEGRMENGWASGVLHQRTKTVKAGPMVYMDCYPVWDTKGASQARREAKKEAHAKAQARLDAKRRARRVEQLVNTNFGAGDMLLTCEYAQGHQPEDGAQAKRDIVNFLRRVNGLCAKRGLAMRRYIYVTEWTKSEKYGIRWHHHVILSGEGLTREDVEGKWTGRHGGYCNTRRAQPNEKHLSGFAHCGDDRGHDPGEGDFCQALSPVRAAGGYGEEKRMGGGRIHTGAAQKNRETEGQAWSWRKRLNGYGNWNGRIRASRRRERTCAGMPRH